MKSQLLLALVSLATCSSALANEVLRAQTVWSPEVETLYETDTPLPAWLTSPTNMVVVKGVLDGGDQTAMGQAVNEVILPKLPKRSQENWTDRDLEIARREIRRWLQRPHRVAERFEQPFYKVIDGERFPAFTREAILLNLPEGELNSLAHHIHYRQHTLRRNRTVTLAVSMGIVAILFCTCWIVCGVLDRMTRGYYIGWLRVAAATTFVLSVGFTLQLTRWILRTM